MPPNLIPSLMLKSFFGSKTRVKLLGLFLLHPQNEYFIRELTRILKEQINSIRRELNNLRKVGLLKTYTKNRKKYFYLNTEFQLLEEFRNIFAKTAEPQDEVVKAVAKFGAVDFLLLTGQFVGQIAKDDTSVDMLVVGDVDKDGLKTFLDKELTAQKVRFTVMGRADFLYRLDCKDKFVLDLLAARDKMIPVNTIKKYIEARTKSVVK